MSIHDQTPLSGQPQVSTAGISIVAALQQEVRDRMRDLIAAEREATRWQKIAQDRLEEILELEGIAEYDDARTKAIQRGVNVLGSSPVEALTKILELQAEVDRLRAVTCECAPLTERHGLKVDPDGMLDLDSGSWVMDRETAGQLAATLAHFKRTGVLPSRKD